MILDELGEGPVVFFDGVCNLCTGSVQFIIKHDKKKQFRFASLQSGIGIEVTKRLKAETGKMPDSLILFYRQTFFVKSSAVLHISNLLGGVWKISTILLFVPRFVRNPVYDLIAKNRYNWFGKKNECMIPTPELKSRFLD